MHDCVQAACSAWQRAAVNDGYGAIDAPAEDCLSRAAIAGLNVAAMLLLARAKRPPIAACS